jgi:hypothetical protein
VLDQTETNTLFKSFNKMLKMLPCFFSFFRVGATFEMIRTELRGICISIDHEPGVAAPFKWKRERQGSRETERERECVCECRSTPG